MNITEFGELITSKEVTIKEENSSEKSFQIAFANALLDKGFKVFMEYPYPKQSKDECDIVITTKEDYNKVICWIEVKPIWSENCNYLNPSKFFQDSPFKEDIKKLFSVSSENSKAWFTLLLFSKKNIDMSSYTPPKERKGLSPEQIIKSISNWANKEHPDFQHTTLKSGVYTHILLWEISSYNDKDIKSKEGEYILT